MLSCAIKPKLARVWVGKKLRQVVRAGPVERRGEQHAVRAEAGECPRGNS